MTNGWPPSAHHNVALWGRTAGVAWIVPRRTLRRPCGCCGTSGADDRWVELPEVDLERPRKSLKVSDVDALGASPAGAPADRLVHVPEHRQIRAVLVDRFKQARSVHLQPSGDDVIT